MKKGGQTAVNSGGSYGNQAIAVLQDGLLSVSI